MDYQNVHLVTNNLIIVTAQQIANLEAILGTPMPPGYQEYLTTLGVGVLNDTVRVYSPMQIMHTYQAVRERWNAYYFWAAGADVLTKDRVLESIVVADTGSGDELIFHPSAPDTLYVLPIDHERVFRAGEGLDAAIDWLLSSSILNEDTKSDKDASLSQYYFEPFLPVQEQRLYPRNMRRVFRPQYKRPLR